MTGKHITTANAATITALSNKLMSGSESADTFSVAGKYLYMDGGVYDSEQYCITPFLDTSNATRIEIRQAVATATGVWAYCFYDVDNNIISYNPPVAAPTEFNISLSGSDIPQGAKFIRCTSFLSLPEKSVTVVNKSSLNPFYKKKWMLIGDSQTEENFRSAANYHDFVKDELLIETINTAASGAGFRIYLYDPLRFSTILDAYIVANPNVAPDFITVMGGINDLEFDSAPIGNATDITDDSLMGSVYLMMLNIISHFPYTPFGIMSPIAERHFPNIDSNATLRYRFDFSSAITVSVGDVYSCLTTNETTKNYEVTETHLAAGIGYIYCTTADRSCPCYPGDIISATPFNGVMTKISGNAGSDATITLSASSNNGLHLFVVKLKEFCEHYNVPFLDQYHNSGLRPWDSAFNDKFFKYNDVVTHGDGLHPNYYGHKLMYPRIREFVKSII